MNQIAWQIYGGSNRKVNTFIGGVASTITTSGALATRLAIASNRITNFKIVGSNIECRISGSYNIPVTFCQISPSVQLAITYYRDFDGLVTSIESQAFYWTNIREVYTPNATQILDLAFDQNGNIGQDKNALKMLYIPRVTTIGSTVLNNNVFRSGNLGGGKIYAHPSLQTINAGGVEGDLAYLATGNIIRYVTNFTAPNLITNLSAGTTYGTTVQLNFTAPTGSANAIDYYELWQNGVNTGKTVTASGQYITGLTLNTAYTFQLIPVDIFYNKSTSNVVSVTTAISYTDADANAYISAATLTAIEQDSAYQLITDLKTAGLWTKIQAIYPFKGTTAAQHKWNAKNPLDTNAAFRLTFSGTGNYSNLGFQCNGTNSYANTFFAPSTNQNVNNNGLTVVVGTNNLPLNACVEIGSYTGETQMSYLRVKADSTNQNKSSILNSRSGAATTPNGVQDSKGILTGTKTSSTVNKLFHNGISVATGTGGGTLPTNNFVIGGLTGGIALSNQRIQIAIIHEGLSDAEVATLHAIIDTSEAIAGRKTW